MDRKLPASLQIDESPKIHRSRYGSVLACQIYFDEFSKHNLDPGFSPVCHQGNSPFFESQVISDLIQAGYHNDADFFGVFSWKIKPRTGLNSQIVFDMMEHDRYGSDVYACPFIEESSSVWLQGIKEDSGSAHLRAIGTLLFKRMGFDLDLEKLETPILYMNAFIARSTIYQKFHQEMLLPALNILSDSTDIEMQNLLNKHAHYVSEFPHPKLLPRLKAIFGRTQFKFHPFVTERLFPTWLALRLPIEHVKVAKFPLYRPPMGIIMAN